MYFKCVKRSNWLLKALMFIAWPWESCPNWLNLQVYAVRVQYDTETYVSVQIGKA